MDHDPLVTGTGKYRMPFAVLQMGGLDHVDRVRFSPSPVGMKKALNELLLKITYTLTNTSHGIGWHGP